MICLILEIDYSDYGDTHSRIYEVGKRWLNGYKRSFAAHGVPWYDDYVILTDASVAAGEENFGAVWSGKAR